METNDELDNLKNRIYKIETSLDTILRLEEKIDKIAEITTKIASIEERHHYQSTAIERAFKAIEKNASQIDSLRESFIDHDKYSERAVSEIKNDIFTRIEVVDKLNKESLNAHKKEINAIKTDIVSKTSWTKGAWFGAGIFMTLIQVGVIWGLKGTINTIQEIKNDHVEMRIDNDRIKQRQVTLEIEIEAIRESGHNNKK